MKGGNKEKVDQRVGAVGQSKGSMQLIVLTTLPPRALSRASSIAVTPSLSSKVLTRAPTA